MNVNYELASFLLLGTHHSSTLTHVEKFKHNPCYWSEKYVIMKNINVSICLLMLTALFGCGKPATTIVSDGDKELTGKWQLETVIQKRDTILKPAVKNGMYDVSLTFKEKGELEATSSTNYLTGFYETGQLNAIYLSGDGTERKETSWGSLFMNALPQINLYDLNSSNRLVLYYNNESQLIFSRVQ
jgi:hypothetical protein